MKFRLFQNRKISTQKGGALFVLLMIIGIAAILLVGTLTRKATQIERDKQTASALAQAKDALIGYAATYRDRNGSNVFGFLPCPDMGRNGQEGMEDSAGCIDSNNKDKSVIGRLPWRTLGLGPLRDGNGDCLWYAVSGTFKNKTQTDLMNGDTNGQFEVIAPDGVTKITGAAPTNRAVAIVFSAGTPLGSQNRAPDAGITAPECGGNMDAANYLDAATIGGTPFANYLANASSISTSAKHVIDAAAAQIKQFIAGEAKDATGNTLINDRLLLITPDEIFAQKVEKRPDFPAYLAPPTWAANTAYKSRIYVSPTVYNGHCYQSDSSGTSGSSEPAWPTDGTAVADNGISWKDIGVSCQALAKTAECIAQYGLTPPNTTRRLPWAAPLDMDALGATKYGTSSNYAATTNLLAGRTPYRINGANWIDSANTDCPNFDVSAEAWWQNYKDQLFYAVADAYKPGSGVANCGIPSTCLTVDGHGPYAAAIILSGRKLAAENASTGQSRNTNTDYTSADKSSLLNYLAASNRTAMAAPGNGNFSKGSFAGASNNDVLVCLKCDLSLDVGCNAASLPNCVSLISFQNNLGEFIPVGSGTGGVTTDAVNKTVTLVPAAAGNAAGCFWYPNPQPLYAPGSNLTLRAYYEFAFAKKDDYNTVQYSPNPQASSQYGYGFTFAVVPGNVAITDQCGTAASTGIAGGTMGTLATTNLFLETDVWSPSTPNTSIEYPYTTSAGKRAFLGNHIAIRSNSDLAPATNDVTNACDGTQAGCYKSGDPTWMEDPSGGGPAAATIKIGNSGTDDSIGITDVKVNGVSIINTPITAAGGTNSATERQTAAADLAAAINSFVSTPDYIACAGTACTPALAADTVKVISVVNGAGPNGYVVQVTSSQTGTPATASVTFTKANAGTSVTSVKVNGVEILNATVTASGNTDLKRRRSLARGVCDQINAYLNGAPFEYTAAEAVGSSCPTTNDTFYILAPPSAGAAPNGYAVQITPASSPALTYAVANGSTLAGGVTVTLPVTDANGNTPILMSGGNAALPNQRIEIMTRCDTACTTCNTSNGTRMLVKAWAQCTGCSDTSVNYPSAPMAQACINMTTAISQMDVVNFGFTAGSLPAPNHQSPTIRNFVLTIN